MCHRASLCNDCHVIKMPHPANWRQAHGTAAKSPDAPCARCHHQSQCQSCHGLAMPHPDDWTEKHGAQAKASPAVCRRCHAAKRHDCNTCHEGLAPSDHSAATWKTTHGKAGSSSKDLCALCHGANSCADCHARKGVGAANKGTGKPQ